MGGLYLRGGLSGTASAGSPVYGGAASYVQGADATSAAFSDGVTTPYKGGSMNLKHSAGIAFWLGIGAIGALVLIRSSLPN